MGQRFESRRKMIACKEASMRHRLIEEGDDSPRSSDGEDSTGCSSSSMEDWEQGLEALNSIGSRDRAAKLRAHMLLAATKRSPTKPAARAQLDAVELLQSVVAAR